MQSESQVGLTGYGVDSHWGKLKFGGCKIKSKIYSLRKLIERLNDEESFYYPTNKNVRLADLLLQNTVDSQIYETWNIYGTSWVHCSLYLLCQLTTDQIKRQLQHETWQKWCQASGQHERTTQPQKKRTNRKNHMYRTPTFVLNSKCTEIKFKPSFNFIFLKYLKTELVSRGVRIWKVIIMLLIYVGNILKDIILWEYLAHLQ